MHDIERKLKLSWGDRVTGGQRHQYLPKYSLNKKKIIGRGQNPLVISSSAISVKNQRIFSPEIDEFQPKLVIF